MDPANSSEGFEIVRSRLFKNDMDYAARDAVSKVFSKMYKEQTSEFPSECREAQYVRNLESCYPIHPELFRQFEQGGLPWISFKEHGESQDLWLL